MSVRAIGAGELPAVLAAWTTMADDVASRVSRSRDNLTSMAYKREPQELLVNARKPLEDLVDDPTVFAGVRDAAGQALRPDVFPTEAEPYAPTPQPVLDALDRVVAAAREPERWAKTELAKIADATLATGSEPRTLVAPST